jgi:hypothetical protein
MFRSSQHRQLMAFATIALFANFSVMSAVYADTPIPLIMAPVAVQAGKILVPEGTSIKLLLDDDLKSGSAHVGDTVDYEVENDLYTIDRQLICPAGTKAFGKVMASSGHGMFGKPGKLRLSCDYILDPDRTQIPLRGTQIGNGGKSEVGGMVAMVFFVSIIGGIFINGRDVNLHKGMEVKMFCNADTDVTPYITILANAGLAPAALATVLMQTLYILNDGTQIIGTQNADDGTNYAVTTTTGIKLIPVASVKSTFQVVAPTPTPKATVPVVATTISSIADPLYMFTLVDNSMYYGTLITGDTTVPTGFTKISNSAGTRLIKQSSITTQVIVSSEETAKALGAVE